MDEIGIFFKKMKFSQIVGLYNTDVSVWRCGDGVCKVDPLKKMENFQFHCFNVKDYQKENSKAHMQCNKVTARVQAV